MSRVITVKVVDSDGYGKSGYKISTYSDSDNPVYTDSNGTCCVTVTGDDAIYCNGATIKATQEGWFDKTVIYKV